MDVWLWPLDEIWGTDREIVLEERQKFVSLKADRKMQLDLELLHMKGFHVLDNLVLEAMAGIKFREIEKFTSEEDHFAKTSYARHYFCNAIYEEFYGLSTMKSFALDEIWGSDREIMLEERQKFVSLKADRKMQLDLELLHMKGFHVLDNLVLEAMADIKFREIEKFTSEEDRFAKTSYARHYFCNAIYEEFYGLSTMKSFAHEKHKKRKDPEHPNKHKVEEEIAAVAAVGAGAMSSTSIMRREAKEQEKEAHGKKHHHIF